MKKLNQTLRVLLLVLIVATGFLQNVYAIPGLVGIVNNCRKATIKLTDASGKPLSIFRGGVGQFAPVLIPDSRPLSEDQKWTRPLSISLEIDRGSEGIKNENVQVIVHSEFENQLIVRAKGPNSVIREARITNAMNNAHFLGIGPNPWQGVFVCFEDLIRQD
jgi:hypothetical protein